MTRGAGLVSSQISLSLSLSIYIHTNVDIYRGIHTCTCASFIANTNEKSSQTVLICKTHLFDGLEFSDVDRFFQEA